MGKKGTQFVCALVSGARAKRAGSSLLTTPWLAIPMLVSGFQTKLRGSVERFAPCYLRKVRYLRRYCSGTLRVARSSGAQSEG